MNRVYDGFFDLQLYNCQVGLNDVPFDKDPQSLSGGYKRRLALAIQLVRASICVPIFVFTIYSFVS